MPKESEEKAAQASGIFVTLGLASLLIAAGLVSPAALFLAIGIEALVLAAVVHPRKEV